MNNNELIARLVEALAWPVMTLLIVLTLRKQLTDLLHSLGKMKVQGVELEFSKGLEAAEKDAKQLNLPPADDVAALPSALPPNSFYEQAMSLASIAPRAAITEAWRAVEIAIAEAGRSHGITVRAPIAGARVIRKLIEDGKLDNATLSLYNKLRQMRGEAAHAPEFQIESAEAMRYVDLSLSLANKFQKLAAFKSSEKKKMSRGAG